MESRPLTCCGRENHGCQMSIVVDDSAEASIVDFVLHGNYHDSTTTGTNRIYCSLIFRSPDVIDIEELIRIHE